MRLPIINDILTASERVRAALTLPTPLERALWLGDNAYVKLETVNPTHSFKIRGAVNAMLRLKAEGRGGAGVIAASSGNHAQALAYAAHLTGVDAQILMPKHTPQKKVAGVRGYGAHALLYGETYDEAETEAIRRATESGIPYISPYNHPDIIAGAGTVGVEIAAQLPNVGRVLVPLSGGGLLSGVALALATLAPQCEVIGVCAEHAPAGYNLIHGADKPQIWQTLAEALSGDIERDSMTIDLLKTHIRRVVLVDEAAIAEAMRVMVYRHGVVAEGGGAVGVAAVLSGVIALDERPIVTVISGGNVDEAQLRRVLLG